MAIESIPPDTILESFTRYKEISLLIIITHFLIDFYVCSRQLTRLKSDRPLPKFLSDINISEEEYNKGRNYSKDKLQFNLTIDGFQTLLEMILLYINYQAFVWNTSADILAHYEIDSNNEFFRGCLFMLIESFRSLILDTPIDYYRSFVLEEKHGFNKKTIKVFVYDLCVGFALKIGITFPILYGFLAVVDYGGEYFFFYAQVFCVIVMFIMMLIYPNYIAPLFNKFEELDDGELKDGINKLAASVNFPATKIYKVDGSKRSSHSNAYFYGFGKNKRIVLFDTLLTQVKNEEIYAILCHEMGHWQFGHMWMNLGFAFVQLFSIFYIFGFFRNKAEIYRSFNFTDKSTFIGITLFTLIYSPISFFLSKLMLKMSRRNEFQADAYAHNFGHTDNLASGLIKINKENSSDMDPDSVYSSFYNSHPTLIERLDALNALAKKN